MKLINGILRPGDTVLSINGKPYDTLDEVIGIVENPSSLKAFGVKYEQVEMKDGKFDIEKIKERVSKNDIKLIISQRSRGYLYRDAFTMEEFEEVFLQLCLLQRCWQDFQQPIQLLKDDCKDT